MAHKSPTIEEIKKELDLYAGTKLSPAQERMVETYRKEYANKSVILLEEYMQKELDVIKDAKLALLD